MFRLLSIFILPSLILVLYPPLSLLPPLPVPLSSLRLLLQILTYSLGIYTSRLSQLLTLLLLSLKFNLINRPDPLTDFLNNVTKNQSPEITESFFLAWLSLTVGLMGYARLPSKVSPPSSSKPSSLDSTLTSLKKLKKVLGSEAELAALSSQPSLASVPPRNTENEKESKLDKAKREAREEQAKRVEETLRKKGKKD
mmetsp:Transcript_26471/g.50157  ORF Transcript_26471/g.50157 Transcript_26471/m.50157 type:complete len:197 (-) Transcript_26471:166-756(-)